MQIRMQNAENLTEQISGFLEATQTIEFGGQSRAEVYAWTQRVLVNQEYAGQSKRQRGAIRAWLSKMTGLSLPQITRLIRMYVDTGTVEPRPCQRHRFVSKYSPDDVVLLAEVDRAHERLSGPATQCILRREYQQFGKEQYARLAGISVAHLYNLRPGARYRKTAGVFETTRPSAVSIGERRKPDPQGRPGFLRVDTVHQGDWEGTRGVYPAPCIGIELPFQDHSSIEKCWRPNAVNPFGDPEVDNESAGETNLSPLPPPSSARRPTEADAPHSRRFRCRHGHRCPVAAQQHRH